MSVLHRPACAVFEFVAFRALRLSRSRLVVRRSVCDPCHVNAGATMAKKREKTKQCPGPAKCPLRVAHAPNGPEADCEFNVSAEGESATGGLIGPKSRCLTAVLCVSTSGWLRRVSGEGGQSVGRAQEGGGRQRSSGSRRCGSSEGTQEKISADTQQAALSNLRSSSPRNRAISIRALCLRLFVDVAKRRHTRLCLITLSVLRNHDQLELAVLLKSAMTIMCD